MTTVVKTRTARTFGRFVVVGLLNTVFGYAVFVLLLWIGVPAQPALAIAFVIGVIWNYFTTARLVFQTAGFGKLPAYIAAYGVVYASNALTLHAALAAGIGAYVAQALLTPIFAILSFILLSRVFRRNDPG